MKRIKALAYNIDQDARVAAEQLRSEKREAEHREVIHFLQKQVHRPLEPAMLLNKVPYQDLPVIRNQAFFGRAAELDQLAAFLDPGAVQARDLVCASLYGLAGSGKTQLALEFAHRHLHAYDVILWVAAETPLKLAESFNRIAHGLGLADESLQHSDQLREAVKRWLCAASKRTKTGEDGGPTVKWLIIFDNIENASLVSPYWPHTSHGAILITCRSEEVANEFSARTQRGRAAMHIAPFPSLEASRFLLALLDKGSPSLEEETLALQIAKSVGNHPLALDLLGCYMRRHGKSMRRFLREHPDFERNLLFQPDLRDRTKNAYQLSMGRIWALSLVEDDGARLLIDMLALLDSDGVPLSFFVNNSRQAMYVSQ